MTVLYFFAGPSRQGDLGWNICAIGLKKNIILRVIKVYFKRDEAHDLLSEQLQSAMIADIRGNLVNFVFLSPPCSTWSRSLFNRLAIGPLPLRSKTHPWGFPWLTGARKEKIAAANSLMRFSLMVIDAACSADVGGDAGAPGGPGGIPRR